MIVVMKRSATEADINAMIAPVEAKGLKQISDSSELEAIADGVIAANAQQVADYRSGKEKAFNSLVGQVMKATKGKANPQQVNAILKRKLSS
jgi:aspartyl-tRNA(Asn)/glutamyl-tRNA(Gln) amidotransferase subunit B